MRLHAQTGPIENGFILLPREAHYDDQIDSTLQVLAWTNQRFPGWGILEFYRRQADHCGMQIGVTDAGRHHLDQHFARSRRRRLRFANRHLLAPIRHSDHGRGFKHGARIQIGPSGMAEKTKCSKSRAPRSPDVDRVPAGGAGKGTQVSLSYCDPSHLVLPLNLQ